MRSGFSLGRVFGIQIRIDWSWVFIFLLISWNLATAMGNMHQDWGGFQQWSVAVAGALLFFLSVLAHELAHSLVAKSRGIPVTSIRLHLFGGVSNIQREPDSPGGEFVMAILGPLTSLVIGALLLIVTGVMSSLTATGEQSVQDMLGQLNPAFTILGWLGSVNLGLGIFNLIPGFPLDGGRILRSILWAITDNLRKATRWASWVGQAISWLMIFAGAAMAFGVRIPLLGQGFTNGLWFAFIGWFLHNAAVQSYQQMIIHDALESITVSEVMRKNPPTVSSSRTVTEFVHDYIMQTDEQGFPVVDQGTLVGLVTLGDVRSIDRETWQSTTVADIMTPANELACVEPEETASRALEELGRRDVRQVPVLSDGRLVGLLRRRDVVKWLQLQSDVPASAGR